ncbi:DoxX family protein [Jiulongibacter sediminis]|jgi:hypothetical protein|uniref:DoxX family protein n=1 Tax=Jiulongibacter sediminis TaxID=1605367 RepID=UPI0026F132AD|nr:DoxX family protein [Jiulongibacter sediminis]
MNRQNITYWVVTGLFAAFMIFSSIGNITKDPEAVKMITGLGYPEYFIPYIGYMKVIGSVLILLPMIPRNVKEWAYAGLFFDLLSAFVSIILTEGFSPQVAFFFVFVGFLFLSYYFWYRKMGWLKA